MAERMRLTERTAVITGAGSGIGRALALSLVRRGCHIALADIDPVGLTETASMAQPRGTRLTCHVLDVADAAAVAALPNAVRAEHGGADLLINNAGVAIGGTFEQVSAEDFDWLFAINFGGVVRMTRAFLPLLRASDDARIVNLSSLFGLIAPPGQTAYVASKFAVRGFSESLRHELKGSSVGITVVHPGGVSTNIALRARIPVDASPEEVAERRAAIQKVLRMPPPLAAETIIRGIERRKPRVIVGADAHLGSLLERLAPVTYWNLISRVVRL